MIPIPHNLSRVVLTLVFGSMVLMTGMNDSAWAGDRKVYSAALCTPSTPTAGNIQNKEFRYGNGSIYNFSTRRELLIECPVTRDNTTNKNGVKRWGFVGKNMADKDRKLSCDLRSRHAEGGSLIRSSKTTLTFNYGKRAFKDISKEPRLSNKNGDSYYTLYCRIPPGQPGKEPSHLSAYYVEEY